MDDSSSNLALQEDIGLFWTSTAILIILAVFGVGLAGVAVGPFEVPPFILYLVVHVILMIALIISRSEYVLDFPGPMLTLLFFAMYVLVSSLWASDTVLAMKEMSLIVTSILTGLFVYWSVSSRQVLSKYLSVLKLLALIGIVIAVVEITTGVHLPVSKRHGTVSYYTSTAWYVNENDFSMFLSMVSFLFFAKGLSAESISSRGLGIVAFLACSIILIVNDARASLLAVLVVGLILIGLHSGRNVLRRLVSKPFRTPVFTASALLGASAFVGLGLIMSNPFNSQFSYSLWFRWQALEAGVFLLFNTVVGTGVGNFPIQWSQINIPPAVEANAHNWFVTLISEYGFIGSILFLLAYGKCLDGLLRQYLRYRDPTALALLGSLLSFSLAGLGPSDSMTFQIQWIVLGLAMAVIFRVPGSDVTVPD
ncbi:O-antigen ligase family protein [Salinigranum rubrum]|uniref:O-antigen ligase family protein n=1 Tax=Salinigranum rubrum TaxID=755307 RepID=UPI0013A5A496|nr:O-antigen ligase family protein [Salinigranum rubrum]